MSFLRDDARAALLRWREVIGAVAVTALGLWWASLGGMILLPFGLALAALGAGWAWTALRRLRFQPLGDAPGVVELDEGRITYFGLSGGGSVGLSDLAELRLLRMRGRAVWRLKQGDGQAILIPAEAQGAEALFDAFASLPGIDLGQVVAAVAESPPPQSGGLVSSLGENRVIWRRSGQGVVRQ
jgi:hypothetical protein